MRKSNNYYENNNNNEDDGDNEKSYLLTHNKYSINSPPDFYEDENVPLYSEDENDESSFLNPQPLVGSFSSSKMYSPLTPPSYPSYPNFLLNNPKLPKNSPQSPLNTNSPSGSYSPLGTSLNSSSNSNIQINENRKPIPSIKYQENDPEVSIQSRFEPHARKPYIPSEPGMALRMRYYGKLAGNTVEEQQKYVLPAHVVPSSLLLPSLPSFRNFFGKKKKPEEEEEYGGDTMGEVEEGEDEPKKGSITLIFSIWNTMMGSSLLALPWGFTTSGFIMGLIVVFVVGALCCYTCLLILKHGKESADFFYLCNDYLGKWGKYACWFASIAMLVGGVIAYDILMTEVLFSSVQSVYVISNNVIDNVFDLGDEYSAGTIKFYSSEFDEEPTTHVYWNNYICSTLVFIVMFPLCNMKSFSFIVMINTFGVVPIIYTVLFILLQSVFGENLDVKGMPLYQSTFFVLAGLLSVSFYIHGLILPIMKTAKNPENNPRDLTIGYLLVGLSYAIVGGVAYLYYWDTENFPQEFLQVYSNTMIGAVLANMLLLFQLATVFPLLLLIIRIQFFGLLWNSQYPSWMHVYGLNFALIFMATMFSMFFPSFGTILSITGAVFGTIIVFILPISVHLRAMKQSTGEWGIIRCTIHIGIIFFAIIVALGQFIF